jgi:hypothetical protein
MSVFSKLRLVYSYCQSYEHCEIVCPLLQALIHTINLVYNGKIKNSYIINTEEKFPENRLYPTGDFL